MRSWHKFGNLALHVSRLVCWPRNHDFGYPCGDFRNNIASQYLMTGKDVYSKTDNTGENLSCSFSISLKERKLSRSLESVSQDVIAWKSSPFERLKDPWGKWQYFSMSLDDRDRRLSRLRGHVFSIKNKTREILSLLFSSSPHVRKLSRFLKCT